MKKNTPEYWKAVREVTWGHLVTVGFFAIVLIQICLVILYYFPESSRRTTTSLTDTIILMVLIDTYSIGAAFRSAIKIINEEIKSDNTEYKYQEFEYIYQKDESEHIDQGDW